MELFPINVRLNEPFSVDLDNSALWLKSCTVTGSGRYLLQARVKNQLSENDGKSALHSPAFNIAVLDTENCPNVALDLKLDSEEAVFSLKAIGGASKKSGEALVTIIANKQSFGGEDSEDSEVPKLVEVSKVPELVEKSKAPESKKRSAEESALISEKTLKKAKKEESDLAARKKMVEQKREADIAAKKAEREEAEKEKVAEKEEAFKKAALEKKKAELEKKKAEMASEKKKAELEKKKAAELEKAKENKFPVRRTLQGGLKVEIHKQGNIKGPQSKRGRTIKMKYCGRLASNGKQFDKGNIDFKLGVGQVIQGWDVGCADMFIGEKRKLLIPAAMGYGARGAPPQIPKNAALVFDVELLGIK